MKSANPVVLDSLLQNFARLHGVSEEFVDALLAEIDGYDRRRDARFATRRLNSTAVLSLEPPDPAATSAEARLDRVRALALLAWLFGQSS